MDIKYLGPSPEVNVAPYGPHKKGKIKKYTAEFGKELLATSKKQKFEEVKGGNSGGSGKTAPDADREKKILAAAKMCIDNGDVISSGKPDIKAMAELLEFEITAAERDAAWDKLQESAGGK